MIKYAILVLGLVFVQGAQAAETGTLIDGSDVEAVVNIARDYGSATVGMQQSGQAKIIARMDGVNYVAYFQNCSAARICDDLNLYAGFLDIKPSQERINAWNASKRFGRAYIDPDGDAAMEMDINLKNGVSPANLSASFAIWRLILRQFVGYLEPDMPAPLRVIAPPAAEEPESTNPAGEAAEGEAGAEHSSAEEKDTGGHAPAGH